MNVTLSVETAGQRADQFLAARLDGLTRSAAQKLLEEGHVLCQGRPLKKNDRLKPGDQVAVCIPDPTPVELLPQDIPLEVVYEDEDVIVVNKPVGMVVHPAPGHPDGTLVNALLFHCGQSLSGINGQLRPGIVHRIDRDYEAVVLGNLREDQGTISLPIARHPTDRKKMAVNHSSGRPAVTHWTVLARYPGYTHVQCRLETGRTHQIRVHMAAQGHPVLGDPVYNGLRKGFPELAGQCLHARRLSFQHPRTGERMTLSSPLPAYFQTVLTRCSRLV